MEEEKFFEMIDHLKDIIDNDKAKSDDIKAHYKHCKWPILYRISNLLSSMTLDLQKILEAIVDTAIEITEANRGFFILYDDEGSFEVQIARTSGKVSLDPSAFHFSETIVKQALKEKSALILPEIQKELSLSDASSVLDLALSSAMCIPLIQHSDSELPDKRRQYDEERGEDVIGVLYVDSTKKEGSFSDEDLTFFRTLANQATAAIIHTRLYLQATTDPLTDLYNRRQFELSLKEIFRRSETSQNPFSLLMLDIDHFKKVNDNYGHDVGDLVIQRVARVLKENVRTGDVCARYGGEEFAIILANTPPEGAVVIAEKIRQAMETTNWDQEGLSVTTSIGVSSCPLHTTDLEALVKTSDQGLYLSKENGRNQVTLWSAEMEGHAKRFDQLAGIITGDYARDYRNVTMLLNTISAIHSSRSVEEMLEQAVDKVIEALEAERSALMMIDDDGELKVTLCRDPRGNNLKLETLFSKSIPQKVALTGQSIYILDTEEEDILSTESMAALHLRAIMCVPLQARQKIIGVLYADSQQKANTFTERDLPFLEALALQIGLAIENARLLAKLNSEEEK